LSGSAPEPGDLERLIGQLSGSVRDARVLEAIRAVPRRAFVPDDLKARAYENVALPIGAGQTISQPLVVARMLELLELGGDELVLDVGTGSGYHAALLGRLSQRVISIERHAELSDRAAASLADAGVANVELVVGDGSRGLPEHGPFDAINVAAAGDLESLRGLSRQLAPGGRLVAPMSDPDQPEAQRLVLVHADSHGTYADWREPVRFVPLVSDSAD
jgi:protein-L-isoaspartate(D-aspartate) O-methyltransferase